MRRTLLLALLLGALMPLASLARAHAVTRPHVLGGMIRDIPSHRHARRLVFAHAANLPYGGGPVLHSNRTHLIFWAPSGSGLTFEPGYQPLIEQFLRRVAADSHNPTNVYGLTGQYTDDHGPAAYRSSYGGAVVDTDRLPQNGCVEPPVTGPGWTVCVTDSQIQAEIEHVVRVDHLPTGPTDVYFLVTPRGLGSCTDSTSTGCALGGSINGYCGYHSQTTDGLLLYGVIPYNAVPGHCQSDNPRPNGSTADPTISTISHEHSEMVTDPSGDAWVDGSGQEDGDLCISSFGPVIGGSGASAWNEAIGGGHYYLQEEWSNENGGCQPRDETTTTSFTAVHKGGHTLTFTGHAHDPDGAIIGYAWFFGGGHVGHGRMITHHFVPSGLFKVVLRTTDKADNWDFYARTVRVSSAAAGRVAPAATKSG